jgi:hypothetical protein
LCLTLDLGVHAFGGKRPICPWVAKIVLHY